MLFIQDSYCISCEHFQQDMHIKYIVFELQTVQRSVGNYLQSQLFGLTLMYGPSTRQPILDPPISLFRDNVRTSGNYCTSIARASGIVHGRVEIPFHSYLRDT